METTVKETILKEVLHRHNKLSDIEGIERGEYKEELEIIYEAMEEYASQPMADIKIVNRES